MKFVKRFVLSLCALLALLLLSVVAVQTWYQLTPLPLLPETRALQTRAAQLPAATDNGYRLYGFFAPREHDPLVYGKCLAANHAERFKPENRVYEPPLAGGAKPAAEREARMQTVNARLEAGERQCLAGGAALALPRELTAARHDLGTPREAKIALASVALDPILLGRAEQVWAGEARRLGVQVDSPMLPYTPLIAVERWRIARAMQAWDAGDRAGAINQWGTTVRNWMKSADDTLIDTMLSINVMTQVLVATQDSVAAASSLDEATATALLTSIAPIEGMPHALSDALLAEWQSQEALIERFAFNPVNELGPDASLMERLQAHTTQLVLDRNDVLNHMARVNLWSQHAVLARARGEPPKPAAPQIPALGCDAAGDWGLACLPFQRNPVGRFMATLLSTAYEDYGTRVADLLTMLNVTRLSIEARRRGLSGEALAQWVATAPDGMRPVGGQTAFRYDAASGRLHFVLQKRSTALGAEGAVSVRL